MDKLTRYRALIRQFLQEKADLMNNHPIPGLETLRLFDEKSDTYLVYTLGWHNRERQQYVTLLARLHEGKIWIEEDGTEEGLADLLVEAGVSKEDIVLAFHAPEMRPFTEFAVA